MSAVLPSLSVDGFITNQDELMIKIFEHFKASDKSQSNFYDEIGSLKFIINEHSETNEIKRLIESTLTTMYLKYFNSVDVNITVDTSDDSSLLAFYIDISTVSTDGSKHTLAISMSGMKNNIESFEILQDKLRS